MADRELEFTTRLAREDVAGVIEALVEGLKDGCLRVHKSNEMLELDVPRVVDLEIEAKINSERAKFEIEVSWLTNRAGSPDEVPEPSGETIADSCVSAEPQPAKRGRKPKTPKAPEGSDVAAEAAAKKPAASSAKATKKAVQKDDLKAVKAASKPKQGAGAATKKAAAVKGKAPKGKGKEAQEPKAKKTPDEKAVPEKV